MLRFVEQHTPVRFALTPEGDPYPDCTGAKPFGRMLSTLPLRQAVAGKWARQIRPSTMPHRITYQEMIACDVLHNPLKAMIRLAPVLAWRTLTGTTAKGSALIAGLLRGCLDAGCEIATDAAARTLTTGGAGRVTGIRLQVRKNETDIEAQSGVVLATGGFEWNDEMRAAHFPGPVDYIGSPRGNTGDGHQMAMQVGARLDQMTEANIVAALPTRYEGKPSALPVKFHAESNVVIVDGTGRRFASEYDFNIGAALNKRRGTQQWPDHQPAWLISDAELRANRR
jgi:3-oxosteroid 1-dehydrogenase